MSILVVSGHTDLNQSYANKIILKELEQHLPEAVFSYLDKLYPGFRIDVAAEQQKLLRAEVIILQFPFFWYGMPSLLKRWIEDVFVHGFSHGSTGTKLHGKKLIISFTYGAPEEMYRHGGFQNYTIDEFIPPMKQFSNLCGMEWQDYICSGGLSYANRGDEAALERMRVKSLAHAQRLIAQLENIAA